MTGSRSPDCARDRAPVPPAILFGRSAEGFPIAQVGETAFAMLPARDGQHYLATAWRLARPLAEWRRSDFYGNSGRLPDETAFRARVLENAEHQRERAALGRIEIHSRIHTPWGVTQGATVYADGVQFHSTAGHGGIKLSAERNRKVHPMLRAKGGWYEEDAAWAVVAITFPQLFTSFERRCAEQTIKNSWPDAWEAIFGTILNPGDSYEKDRRAFEVAHAASWVVVSAITSKHQEGFVECIATLGGRGGDGIKERRFLVASDEYQIGRFGFVIDLDRHPEDGGPSSFVASRRAGS